LGEIKSLSIISGMEKARFTGNCALMTVVASLALVACSPPLDWRTVRPAHAQGLEAVFPCKPAQAERSVKLPALPGPAVVVHLASCKVGDATWALSYFDAQEIGRVAQALAADNRALRDNLEALSHMGTASASADGPVTAQDLGPVQIAGMTPNALSRHWRLVGRRPSDQSGSVAVEVHAWHFSHGLMVYQATLWRPLPTANAKDSTEAVETFIQGFKFSD
jgi:hypothetical protein